MPTMNKGLKAIAKPSLNRKDMISTSPVSSSNGGGGSATRAQRNQAEKQRRDKLNAYINELANIVPMVAMASKRLDKTSILRLSAAHLRIYQSIYGASKQKKSKSIFKWRPNFLTSDKLKELIEAVDGFLIVMTDSGKIIYVSHSIDRFLGHQQIEVIGHSFYSLIHPLDCDSVKQQLLDLSAKALDAEDKVSPRCSLYCRIRERGQPRSEVVTYQLSHLVGHMTLCPATPNKELMLLKGYIRLVHSSPYTELTLSDAIEDEYTTRHHIDGTIIFADHRLSTITGHLPNEVTKLSAYNYILPEDRPVALFAHRQMFTSSTGTGMIVYRLRTQNNSKVYLKSMGYLQYSTRSSDKVDHFLCINKLLLEEEGEREMKKFMDRYTPHINGVSLSSLFDTTNSLEFESILTSFQTPGQRSSSRASAANASTAAHAASSQAASTPTAGSGSPQPSQMVDTTVCGVPRTALPQSMSPLSDCGSSVPEIMDISLDHPLTDLVPLSFSSQDWCVASLQQQDSGGTSGAGLV